MWTTLQTTSQPITSSPEVRTEGFVIKTVFQCFEEEEGNKKQAPDHFF
jgi:hypothetical protein